MLGLATIPALLIIAAVFWFMGRERRTGYDREYEQEPPTDTEPALVPTLLRQGGEAGSYEFTATLFDLVRRGVYKAVPTTTERPIWGGLRHETVSDLELSAGKDGELRAWERDVANVVDGVLDGGSERLSHFRDQIEEERETMHGRFTAFKEHVADEANRRVVVPLDRRPPTRRRHRFSSLSSAVCSSSSLYATGAPSTRATPTCSSSASVPA